MDTGFYMDKWKETTAKNILHITVRAKYLSNINKTSIVHDRQLDYRSTPQVKHNNQADV
jgi:hypothetical protein